MAENEYLSLGKSPRWHRLSRAVRDGLTPSELAELGLVALIKTINAVKKLLPFADLLAAACKGPTAARELLPRCGKAHDYGQLFLENAEAGRGGAAVAENLCARIRDRFFGEIRVHAIGNRDMPKPEVVAERLHAACKLMEAPMHRIAEALASKPSKSLRLASFVKRSRVSTASTETVLKDSLLEIRPS